nr:MAG TPA: Helix-turn-helix XRE-family like protein [Caudoviricetes sp.]
MPFIYETNEQLIIELKKLMLEIKVSQRQIAERLGITPQGLTKLFNKKNFSFEDASKIADAMGYQLEISFHKK